ncbi:fungal-specific transcription factor domain-containing protein [Emericellopsis atlantica]|uniref:Fungal-specific transcription factor domain-containing protein n=1 Tax=Emericellopsis atlantica TaxID=2614577 RepID=A0A9P7ZHQ9_9HYPO|nr:fungal-specific transcription factor domain-containing protein [Emericellopsis atlantica]KAG9251750.1 fungal-specific transcription factor domain-containing protein [Emericellopsis atlantica]
MSVSMYEGSGGSGQISGPHTGLAASRPQVGIERLPTRRMSNEPRESMNCKSCRKRKIKCNRLRPTCEACQVFQCPCIYDAIPKKRGPKTDVLDALLKRVDGLEAKLREKNAEQDPSSTSGDSGEKKAREENEEATKEPPAKRQASENRNSPQEGQFLGSGQCAKPESDTKSPSLGPEIYLDTYFSRFHAKPYHILDESATRQRMQLGQLPGFLQHAIFAVASKYTPHPGGYQAAVDLSEEFATCARRAVDTEDPTLDGLQTMLLLVTSFIASGKGKRAYMLLTTAIGMAMALEIHREVDHAGISPPEKELRRRLFWSCYLLDRFAACGSKRPSLISDKTVMLRLPAWSLGPGTGFIDGEFFQAGSNLQHFQGTGRKSQGSTGMLIDITRILGTTNRYLAAGGVRGDSHFPWHSLSNLSKIRQDLDTWASGTDDVFSSLEALFGQSDSTVLVLSKLIYHLVHCLIYRPFLPIDLAELAGSGQHESWQIEATNMCFLHANAIAELIELGKQANTIEWPAFVGYCICTAGTVHIHGAHYSKQGAVTEMSVFSSSPHFLSRELQHLSELRYAWACVQHHRETLQGMYTAHGELVKTLAGNRMRYTPSFHLEDFFERYANIMGPNGQSFQFDPANLSLSDAVIDFTIDAYSGSDLFAPRAEGSRPSLKRKSTASSSRSRPDLNTMPALETAPTDALTSPTQSRHSVANQGGFAPLADASVGLQSFSHHHQSGHHQRMAGFGESGLSNSNRISATDFAISNQQSTGGQGISKQAGFNPGFSFGATPTAQESNMMGDSASFDPMFGTLPTNAFSSPAAWHNEDGQTRVGQLATSGKPAAPSPENGSNSGSIATGQGDEKDPFLSLLEQLAENEQRINNGAGGSELDFFLAAGINP